MTYMLGYAWRRQQAAKQTSSNDGRLSPAPPLALQASASADASIDDENSSPPATPEGLRPRKSLDVIREELNIPKRVLQQQRVHFDPKLVQSPQVSNSSFYSREESSIMVAESPDLGQARTAVGALVAMSQGIVSHKRAANPSDTGMSVLPPRTWNREEEDDDDEDVSYHRLQDSHDVMWTPGGRMQQPASPDSTLDSSIHPSPSGRSWREWQEQEQHDVSFSSRIGLVANDKQLESHAYNFDPIEAPLEEGRQDEGPNYVVASNPMANVSLLSHSTAAHNESMHSLDSARYSLGSRLGQNEREEDVMENALMKRKAKNQRMAKEQLLMGVVQRLQHDIDLVAHVDALHDEDERWFVKTPMDREGLLLGFSRGTRTNLLRYLKDILHEMSVARPEEFFLSPSQVESMADTHDDLHDALVFLEGMVQIAIPLSDQSPGHRWVCKTEIRSALGLMSIPESPETVRGGDTSVFSLPSEESTTPHTSNLSMATTITSKPSSFHGATSRSSPAHEASQIRRTIEITSTLLQKMSAACHKLANRCSSQDSIRATEEIKRNYLQLMMLNNRDVRSVVDAFVVDIVDVPIVRQVSADDEHVGAERPAVVFKQAKPLVYVIGGAKNISTPANSMFSPCTDDMNTVMIEPDVEDEYEDDLRRQTGSVDLDDKEEQRDGPEDMCDDESLPLDRSLAFYSWGASELLTTPYKHHKE